MSVIRFTDLGIRSLSQGQYFDDRTSTFGLRVGRGKRRGLSLTAPAEINSV
jgi:hypothetical protein